MSRRKPQPIANVLAELFARRGYGRALGDEALAAQWREAAGEALARQTRVVSLRRGVLEVHVAHSLLMQELVFQKQGLLQRLSALEPAGAIRELRFRVGRIA